MSFTARPLSDLLGAELAGLDARLACSPPIQDSLRAALFRHQVLAIRDQALTPQQFVAFARNFGELEPFFTNAYSLPDCPEIYVLSNVRRAGRPIGRDGAGTHWHSDHTFQREPAIATLLYAVDVPEQGGETLFADMYAAYEALSEGEKRRLAGRRALHRYQKKEHLYTAESGLSAAERGGIERLRALRQQEEAAASAPSHPKAALLFHWKSLTRQVRLRGPVERVSDAEADAYFATRPRGAQIGAWASRQSAPLEDRFALERAVARYTAKYAIGTVPRPSHWSGFRVVPLLIEFWHDRPFRLHQRVEFRRETADAPWVKTGLYP